MQQENWAPVMQAAEEEGNVLVIKPLWLDPSRFLIESITKPFSKEREPVPKRKRGAEDEPNLAAEEERGE